MKEDEELGLYDEPFKHKVETIPIEEILANRSNAYEFINIDKMKNIHILPTNKPSRLYYSGLSLAPSIFPRRSYG
jgi:hypothetical protein